MVSARTRRRKAPRRAPVAPRTVVDRNQRAAPPIDDGVEGSRLGRAELIGAAIVAIVAAALFATTFSSNVAAGDAPESVAGVRTLGIIHAPGYPTYVLAARTFGTVLPVGSWALRVNLFSVVCAALTVALVFLVARLFASSIGGAAVGALALATTASFWFNADFAKHYAWTGLLLIAAVFAVVIWQQGGRDGWLAVAAVALGLEVGSGWQLAAIAVVSLVVLVTLDARAPSTRALVIAGTTFATLAVAVFAFVVIRAHQDPTLNWGDATNLSRLWALIARKDFENGTGGSVLGVAGASRLGGIVGGLERDFGLFAALLALVGALSYRRIGIPRSVFLALVIVVNIAAVVIGSGITGLVGFHSVVTQGGYMLFAMFAIAILTAIGVTVAADWCGTVASRSDGSTRSSSVAVAVTILAGAIVLVPSAVVHRAHADLRVAPYADEYGRRVLASLPAHAVLLVWDEDLAFPMEYRQLVERQRPDVTIIAANSLGIPWARTEVSQRSHLGNVLEQPTVFDSVQALASTFLERHRPVYLDINAMLALHDYIGYETRGLVGEVVRGTTGAHTVKDPDAIAAELAHIDRVDGYEKESANRVPFDIAFALHERAHIELAKVYAMQRNRAGAVRELQRALAVAPQNGKLRAAIAEAQAMPPKDLAGFLADA